MTYGFTVRFSTSFSTTSAFDPKTLDATLADLTTLGFAISFMTSASVALADCFLAFIFSIHPWSQETEAFTGQFGSAEVPSPGVTDDEHS
jgi:hypothetical protein